MISRRTARHIAELYEMEFRTYHSLRTSSYYTLNTNRIYDFLFDNSFSAWFCNAVKSTHNYSDTRTFKEFIMKLHTGESQFNSTKDWTWEQRERLGQSYLQDLAEDILMYYTKYPPTASGYVTDPKLTKITSLKESLELDGYKFSNNKLLAPESDILDVQEEVGYLENLFTELNLAEKETVIHHLKLSEEHYLNHKWDDSISNSRKFLECVLREVAVKFSMQFKNTKLSDTIYSRPVQVREFLEKEGLLESKEKEAISSVYGLLSETGSHPYMAQNEQARLLRHLALTFSQFVMIRIKSYSSE